MKQTVLLLALLSAFAHVQAAQDLGDLNLDDLMKTEVISVSKKTQSLADVPASAFVITADDIQRSGAQALPDVLRMVPGIHVAQIDSGRYAVSARGFNGRFANKLQVLVDGRSIYYPVFSGVLWEVDPIPLSDIERIEVIRGPGAAMWGANAVGGVINIISKSAQRQVGTEMQVTVGTEGTHTVQARHGVVLDEQSALKLSAQFRQSDTSEPLSAQTTAQDNLRNKVVDLRYDRNLENGRDITFWLNATHSKAGDSWLVEPTYGVTGVSLQAVPMVQAFHSETVMTRYRWLSNNGIESSVQASITSSGIEVSPYISEDRTTTDLEYQGRLASGKHDLLWGLNYRQSNDEIQTQGNFVSIRQPRHSQRTTGLFVNDDWTLIPEKVTLGMGLRWDGNNRGGNTFSPNGTLMWTPSRSDTSWIKYAQAPRVPARVEQDTTYPLASLTSFSAHGMAVPLIVGIVPSDTLLSPEKSQSLEVGYRKQFSNHLLGDISIYRQRYTGLRGATLSSLPSQMAPYPIFVLNTQLCNCMSGVASGMEMSADWLVSPNWRLQLSYTRQHLSMDATSDPYIAAAGEQAEQATPKHLASLRSQWQLNSQHQVDAWLRVSSAIWRPIQPSPSLNRIPGYATLDLRYTFKPSPKAEYAIGGRNLAGGKRNEYVSDYLPSQPTLVSPTVYVSGRWRY